MPLSLPHFTGSTPIKLSHQQPVSRAVEVSLLRVRQKADSFLRDGKRFFDHFAGFKPRH